MFRDYLKEQGENKTIFEYRNTEEDEQETSAGKVRIKSFGSFHVQYHGEEPKWRTKKTKELFAFLFNKQGVPVSRDTGADHMQERNVLSGCWKDGIRLCVNHGDKGTTGE